MGHAEIERAPTDVALPLRPLRRYGIVS